VHHLHLALCDEYNIVHVVPFIHNNFIGEVLQRFQMGDQMSDKFHIRFAEVFDAPDLLLERPHHKRSVEVGRELEVVQKDLLFRGGPPLEVQQIRRLQRCDIGVDRQVIWR